jgi:hypothetical protein
MIRGQDSKVCNVLFYKLGATRPILRIVGLLELQTSLLNPWVPCPQSISCLPNEYCDLRYICLLEEEMIHRQGVRKTMKLKSKQACGYSKFWLCTNLQHEQLAYSNLGFSLYFTSCCSSNCTCCYEYEGQHLHLSIIWIQPGPLTYRMLLEIDNLQEKSHARIS